MEYCFDWDKFNNTFYKNQKFSHKTNLKYNLFPFTGSKSDTVLDSFDNILGAFLQNIYSVSAPKIDREAIISEICNEIAFDNPSEQEAFKSILRELYFKDEGNLKCNGFNTYKYAKSTKNDYKISEYIVSAFSDKNKILNGISTIDDSRNNILDNLVEAHLPKPSDKANSKEYISFFPQIKDFFTNDLIFLLNDPNSEFSEIVQLLSYYYFFYTSQVLIRLNKFCDGQYALEPVYFCMAWEKTSKSRPCFNLGWRQIDRLLNGMFLHAVLLEMLNQTTSDKRFNYEDIFNVYQNSSVSEQNRIFSGIESLKQSYRTMYAVPDGFQYNPDSYTAGDINSLIRNFFDDISHQFKFSESRQGMDKVYQKSFYSFCRNNFLQYRGTNGLMLALNEQQLVLFSKVVIGNEKQVRLNKLFEGFQARGIFLDKHTQECVVEFFEKLNLIEKKSDSGDAQYVKGIL